MMIIKNYKKVYKIMMIIKNYKKVYKKWAKEQHYNYNDYIKL